MIKKVLASEVASRFDGEVTAPFVTHIIDTVIETIKDELKRGGVVDIRGFGKFYVTKTAERIGRNPKTGEAAIISSRDLVKMKMSDSFKYPNGK